MTCFVNTGFERALKRVRAALEANDLEIAGEINMGAEPRCRVLLVDSPLLVFEGIALDRAAGVYFPLHVVVTADGARTAVSTAARSSEGRLPVGAAGPIEALEQRVATALCALE